MVSGSSFPISSVTLSKSFKPSEASNVRQLNYLISVIPSSSQVGIFFELHFMGYYPDPCPLSVTFTWTPRY